MRGKSQITLSLPPGSARTNLSDKFQISFKYGKSAFMQAFWSKFEFEYVHNDTYIGIYHIAYDHKLKLNKSISKQDLVTIIHNNIFFVCQPMKRGAHFVCIRSSMLLLIILR